MIYGYAFSVTHYTTTFLIISTIHSIYSGELSLSACARLQQQHGAKILVRNGPAFLRSKDAVKWNCVPSDVNALLSRLKQHQAQSAFPCSNPCVGLLSAHSSSSVSTPFVFTSASPFSGNTYDTKVWLREGYFSVNDNISYSCQHIGTYIIRRLIILSRASCHRPTLLQPQAFIPACLGRLLLLRHKSRLDRTVFGSYQTVYLFLVCLFDPSIKIAWPIFHL